MQIQTSRFGPMEVDQTRVIHFPKGVLGFPRYTDYVLLEVGEESSFWWLQCTQMPELAFIVTDPSLFVPTYRVPIKSEQLQSMDLTDPEHAQVLVIVNKHDNVLTGNLQGPLVVNVQTRQAQQLVLSDQRFTTRVPLMEINASMQAVSA